jgi:O-antigen/teichoic acid export membrane protein
VNKQPIITSITFLLLMSWFNRLLGLLSIIVLARLLSPTDLGIMAILMLSLQFTEALTAVGADQYYFQKNNADKTDLNNAWSFNIAIKFIASISLLIVAPILARYFEHADLIPAFITIAFLPLLNALANGYLIECRKNLQYKTIAKLTATTKTISSLLTLLLAWYWQNYWALIVGTITNTFLFVFGSYLLFKQHTNLSFSRWREQFNFSQWIFFKSIIGHIRAKFDSWFVADFQGLSGIGSYNLMKDLVLLPSRELLSPISEILFTAIAKTSDSTAPEKQDQQAQIAKSLMIILLIAMPIAFGWSLIAANFVPFVLGEKWLPYTPLVAVLGFLVVTFSVGNFISQIMTAVGKVKTLFMYDLITTILAISLLLGSISFITTLEQIATLRVSIGVVIVTIGFLWLRQLQLIQLRRLIPLVVLPLGASLLMTNSIKWLPLAHINPLANLIITIALASVVYTTTIIIFCKLTLFGKDESRFLWTLISNTFFNIKERFVK